MATLSFGNVKNTTAVTRLKPWTINEVVLKGVELKTGTSKTGNEWQAMQFHFSGDNGTFDPMFFCPAQGGDERRTGETNGRKWELPSALEQLMMTLTHVVGVLSPEGFEKLKKVSFSLPEDFAKLVDATNKVLKPAFNKPTHIKIAGDNKNYATVPNFISITDDGDIRISNNWIGDNLAWTASETKKMNAAQTAKPTEMKSENNPDTNDSVDDIDDLI